MFQYESGFTSLEKDLNIRKLRPGKLAVYQNEERKQLL